MHTRLLILFFLFFCFGTSKAQTGSIRVISGSACSGVVETPVLANQITGMAALSLRVFFDSSSISYLGVRSVHPGIASAVISGANSRFVIAWFSLQPINLTNDTLLVVRWQQNAGTESVLAFDTQAVGGCEVANGQGQVMPTQFISGMASIIGAQSPLPLNPLRLFSQNQTGYNFTYAAPNCMQQAIFQVATDSQFTHVVHEAIVTDTLYQHDFSGVSPGQGDSVRWWRWGGVYQGDTNWSEPGRFSFGISLSAFNEPFFKPNLYPNPFLSSFRLAHPTWREGDELWIRCMDMHGRLLQEEKRVLVEGNSVAVEIKNTNYHGQMLIHWQQFDKNGLVLANKIGH